MYLLLGTLLYTGSNIILKVTDLTYVGFYIISIMILKGLYSKEFKNVFNSYPLKYYMNKNGMYELLSWCVVISPSYFMKDTEFNIISFLIIICIQLIMARTMMLGTINTFKNIGNK